MAKHSYSVSEIEAALRQTGGVYARAAECLGCVRSTIAKRVRASPRLQAVCRDIAERNLDLAEDRLLQAMLDGSQSAVSLYLKAKGRRRGYGGRAEATVTRRDDGSAVIVYVPDTAMSIEQWVQQFSPARRS
jgi:Bacterial regulatory protein, Fis family